MKSIFLMIEMTTFGEPLFAAIFIVSEGQMIGI
jgi:hypothetical protein